MKRFFNQYSYNIVRDLLNQFAISIFGALLSMATTAAGNKVLAICIGAFAVVFYLFLVYTTTWEIGAKDRISVDVGKKPYRPHTGLLISAVANTPKLIIAILFVIATVFFPKTGMQTVVSLLSMLLSGMYTGLMMSIQITPESTLIGQWWSYFIIIIPALVTSWIAYYAGFKNFRLIAPLFDKKSKKK